MVSHNKIDRFVGVTLQGGEQMKNDIMTKIRDAMKLAKENGDDAFLNRLFGMAQGYAAATSRKKTEKK